MTYEKPHVLQEIGVLFDPDLAKATPATIAQAFAEHRVEIDEMEPHTAYASWAGYTWALTFHFGFPVTFSRFAYRGDPATKSEAADILMTAFARHLHSDLDNDLGAGPGVTGHFFNDRGRLELTVLYNWSCEPGPQA